MSQTTTLLTADTDEPNASFYATASISPSADKLVLAFIRWGGVGITAPSLSGGGLSGWSQEVLSGESNGGEHLAVFRALDNSPGSGTVTIDFGAQTAERAHWIIFEVDKVPTGGTNGADAVIQSAGHATDSGTGQVTSINEALAAFGASDNAAVCGISISQRDNDISPDAGLTEITELGSGTIRHTMACWSDTEDTNPGGSWSDFSHAAIVALEVAESTGPAPGTLAPGEGTDDENVVAEATGLDTDTAVEHEWYRSKSSMADDPETNGTRIQDGLSTASSTLTLVDNEVNSSPSGPEPDTSYFYQLLTRDGSGGTSLSNEIEIHTAPARPTALRAAPANLVEADGADPRMDTEGSEPGVVRDFTKHQSADMAVTFAVSALLRAQEIAVTDTTATTPASHVQIVVPVQPDKPYRLRLQYMTEALSNLTPRVLIDWLDGGGFRTQLDIETLNPAASFQEHVTAQYVSPSDAAELRIILQVLASAIGASGTVWYRDLIPWLDDGSAIRADAFDLIGMDETSREHQNILRIRDTAGGSPHIDRILDPGEKFAHTFEDLTGSQYEVLATAYDQANDRESAPASLTFDLSGKPNTPSISVDAVGETTADLSSSAFSDPQGDAHAASQWQVDATGGDFSAPVFDSGEDTTNLLERTATGLTPGVVYDARVRHKDDQGNWSDWSAPATFATSENEPPDRPEVFVDFVAQTTSDLSSSPYSDPEDDAHAASQWQVDEAAEGDFATPAFDSGTDASNLEAVAVAGLTEGVTYVCRVRHRDAQGNWSPWSETKEFTTQAGGASVQVGVEVRPEDILLGFDMEKGKDGSYVKDPEFSRQTAKWVRSKKAAGRPLAIPRRGNQVPYRRVEVPGIVAPTRAFDIGPAVTPVNPASVDLSPGGTYDGGQFGFDVAEAVDSVYEDLPEGGGSGHYFAPVNFNQVITSIGTFSPSIGGECLVTVLEQSPQSTEAETVAGIWDATVGQWVILYGFNFATAVPTVFDGELVLAEKWTDRGPNGLPTYLLAVKGSPTAGNVRELRAPRLETGEGVIVHLIMHLEVDYPVASLCYMSATPPAKSADRLVVPRIDPQSHVGYTRFVAGSLTSNGAVWSNGDGQANRLELRHQGGGTYELDARDTDGVVSNPQVTLDVEVGQLVELVVIYTQSTGEARLVGRVDRGTAAGASDTPASWTPPNQWSDDRRYGASSVGNRQSRMWLLRDLVMKKAAVDAPLDGSDDDALVDALEDIELPPYGAPR